MSQLAYARMSTDELDTSITQALNAMRASLTAETIVYFSGMTRALMRERATRDDAPVAAPAVPASPAPQPTPPIIGGTRVSLPRGPRSQPPATAYAAVRR